MTDKLKINYISFQIRVGFKGKIAEDKKAKGVKTATYCLSCKRKVEWRLLNISGFKHREYWHIKDDLAKEKVFAVCRRVDTGKYINTGRWHKMT